MNLGNRVQHSVFGMGTIIFIAPKSIFDNRSYGENGVSRYDRSLNIGVKFDNGGPMGFAANSSNNVADLKEIL